MPISAKYVHTNLIARDWRKLADFYVSVFGCEPVPPERDYSGADLERGTGVRGAGLRGVHLRLPGWGPDGPTLEIYQYASMPPRAGTAANRPGFQHIAFVVPSVASARETILGEGGREILAAGGRAVGEVVTLTTADERQVTWCYVTDREGNIIELQAWSDG